MTCEELEYGQDLRVRVGEEVKTAVEYFGDGYGLLALQKALALWMESSNRNKRAGNSTCGADLFYDNSILMRQALSSSTKSSIHKLARLSAIFVNMAILYPRPILFSLLTAMIQFQSW
jgi:hypothetical protein